MAADLTPGTPDTPAVTPDAEKANVKWALGIAEPLRAIPPGDQSQRERALVILAAHVAALTPRLSAETARADAAVAEAKALREAVERELTQGHNYSTFTIDINGRLHTAEGETVFWKNSEVHRVIRDLKDRIRATLAQPADGGK